jgi:hypothetical protein
VPLYKYILNLGQHIPIRDNIPPLHQETRKGLSKIIKRLKQQKTPSAFPIDPATLQSLGLTGNLGFPVSKWQLETSKRSLDG